MGKTRGKNYQTAHIAILRVFTAESSLFSELCRACRTVSPDSGELLKTYSDYLYHFERALSTMESYVGKTYRAISVFLGPDLYQVDSTVTWQSPSSSSVFPLVPTDYTQKTGRKLMGTYFVIYSTAGKDVGQISVFPHEGEVIFGINSHFRVHARLEKRDQKLAEVPELGGYDLEDLDVYVLEQL